MRTTEENSAHFADLSRQLNEDSDVPIARQFIVGMKKIRKPPKMLESENFKSKIE